MKVSSNSFKAVTVSAAISFWYFIISSIVGFFTFETFIIFVVSIFLVTQIIKSKITGFLDILTLFNTKLFLGIIFLTTFTLFGILLKLLRVDLLRKNKQEKSYWLHYDQSPKSTPLKQY